MAEAAYLDSLSTHTSDQDSVENLIQQAQSGDQSAFSRLYDLFRPRVAKFLYNTTGDYWLTDELTNDTFLRAHRALPTLQKHREASFLSFLFRTAANLLCDHHRGKHLPTVTPQDASWDNCPAPADYHQALPFDCLETQERAQMLRRALDQLPPDQAALISLAHFDQLSAEQIARTLSKPSAQAVRAALHRAMQNLHKVLLRQGYFVPAAV